MEKLRMTSPAMQAPLGATLWKVAKAKVQLRWYCVQFGVSAAGFWAVYAIAGSWLRHAGYGWVASLGIGVWAFVALPLLYLQLSLIVDMIGYLFTGSISVYPSLRAAATSPTEAERTAAARELLPPPLDLVPVPDQPRPALSPKQEAFWTLFVTFIEATSPLSCFSSWALIVLMRMPEKAHKRVTVRAVRQLQLAEGRRVYSNTVTHIHGSTQARPR